MAAFILHQIPEFLKHVMNMVNKSHFINISDSKKGMDAKNYLSESILKA